MSGDFDELPSDPDLAVAAGSAREQWRLEEEEYARAAEQHWAHRRTILDIARELMHRGDTVAIEIADVTFRGTVVGVGADYLQLASLCGAVDVALTRVPAVLRVLERARGGGCRVAPGSPSFRARLLEHEVAGGEVVVGSWLAAEQYHGTILIGRDQVRVAGAGGEAYVATSWIGWVRSGGATGSA